MDHLNRKVIREYDLDWIRVIATFVVFLFHCFMFFNPFPWHVKNIELDTGGILVLSLFLGTWIMPLFFMISGISVSLALQTRSIADFIRERFLRLGIPLLVGVFLLSPPQIYVERMSYGQFNGSFFDFIPHYFNGVYLDFGQNGNFAFHGLHLWYLLVLLIFSVTTVFLFKRIRSKTNMSLISFILFPVLLFVSGLIQTISLGGWDLIFYFVVFVGSYYFFANDGFRPALKKSITLHLIIAIATSVVFISWFMLSPPTSGTYLDILYFFIRTLSCYSWLMCIFYVGNKYLSFSNTFLKYGSEASMPFYVLHQPIIVLYGYLLKDIAWAIPLKLVVLIILSFVTIMLIYHFVIQRNNMLRFLFGMKRKLTRTADVKSNSASLQ